MKELVVLSGKGGTGKTSVTACFAVLAGQVILVDADVDAPNLHLIARPQIRETHPFVAGSEASVDPERCIGCGQCAQVCRFDAVRSSPDDSADWPRYEIDPVGCEGCGRCMRVCPAGAIRLEPRNCGRWFFSTTAWGPMVHASLNPGGENSGKLVSLVRAEARKRAEENGGELILVDGPPGIGCPVIASLTGADMTLLVCEPSPSGLHDLRSVLKLARHFGVPAAVCINKWDLNLAASEALAAELATEGIPIAGRISYGPGFSRAQRRAMSLVELGDGRELAELRAVWDNVATMLQSCDRLPLKSGVANDQLARP